MKYTELFERLWMDYTSRNPYVKSIYDHFVSEGETVVNDHIAFRTFEDSRVDINVLSRVFRDVGFVEKGQYHFKKKHLFAKHFELESNPLAPRVFISQLVLKDFSPFLQEVAARIISEIPASLLVSDDIIYSGKTWGMPSFEVYEKLRSESEYVAWLYVNGFTVNHFTVSVNHLKKLDSIHKVNDFLKSKGFLLNDGAGEVQGTPDELLEQSSVRAGMVQVEFKEGLHDVTASYYEFAKRYPDADGKLYSGFIAKSADKIFQSTDLYKQIKK